MSLALSLAWRLFRHGGDAKRISRPAVRIATLGVALGIAVMIISVGVVIGFKQEIEQKVIGMGGHIQVFSDQLTQDYEPSPITISDEIAADIAKTEGVTHTQRYCVKPGMLKTDDSFDGILLRGYGEDFDESFLKDHLLEGEFTGFSAEESSNRIYISRTLAKRLKLKVGSKVYAYFFDKNVRTRMPQVAGIYATNIKEFDNNVVFTDIYTTRRLCGFTADECTGMEISIADFDQLNVSDRAISNKMARLRNKYQSPYTTKTIRQIYAPIFSWLSMLDTNIWVILALMTAVAAFTMISGLLIIILEQTQFIGTMKAMGATNGLLRRLFLHLSVFIIGKGVFIGNVLALGLLFIQQETGVVHLDPENYYVDTVPVVLNIWYIIGINIGTMIISVFVLIIPSFIVSNIHPAKSIRFE